MADLAPEFEISSNKGDPSDIRNFTGVFQNPTSVGNSTVATLGSGATFTGAWEEVSFYAVLTLSAFSDQASASNGLKFQWSSDGSNVDREETTSLSASAGRAFSVTIRAKYFRVVYVNGASAQGAFRLQTIYHTLGHGHISKPLKQLVTEENFAELTQAAIIGKLANGQYTNIAGFAIDGTSLLGMSEAFPLIADRGGGFELAVDGISTGSASESPLLLIDNPSGSGKRLILETAIFGIPSTGTVVYRIYSNPTITANGTEISPVGCRQSGQNSPVAKWYSLPTASAFGNKFFVSRVDSMPLLQDWNLSRVLEPNNKYLVTATQSVSSQSGNLTFQYGEV